MRKIQILLLIIFISGCTSEQARKAAYHEKYFKAAIKGDSDVVKKLIATSKVGINQQDKSFGNTALLYAVIHGHYDLATYLMDAGADLEIKNRFGETFFYQAASRGYRKATREKVMAILKKAIGSGVNINITSTFGYNPVFNAANGCYPEVLKLLIESGADMHTVHKGAIGNLAKPTWVYGVTPIMVAAREGCVECMKLLIEAGAHINRQADNGWTPVMFAVDAGSLRSILFLVHNKADIITIKNKQGYTALQMGLQSRHSKVRIFFETIAKSRK